MPRGSRSEEVVNKRLKVFAGGLPPDTRRDEVLRYFSKFGKVAQCTVHEPKEDDKAPYAFVTYTFAADADCATVESNGFPGAPRPLAMGFASARRKDKAEKKNWDEILNGLEPWKVYVEGITNRDSEEEVGDFFSQWGLISMIYRDKTFAHVHFATREGAMRLMDEATVYYQNRRLDVQPAKSKKVMGPDERDDLIERAIKRHFHKKSVSQAAPGMCGGMPPPGYPGMPPPGYPGMPQPQPGYPPAAGYYGAPPPGYPPSGYPPPGYAGAPGYPPPGAAYTAPGGTPATAAPGAAPPAAGAPPAGYYGGPPPPGAAYGAPHQAAYGAPPGAPGEHGAAPQPGGYPGHPATDAYGRPTGPTDAYGRPAAPTDAYGRPAGPGESGPPQDPRYAAYGASPQPCAPSSAPGYLGAPAPGQSPGVTSPYGDARGAPAHGMHGAPPHGAPPQGVGVPPGYGAHPDLYGQHQGHRYQPY